MTPGEHRTRATIMRCLIFCTTLLTTPAVAFAQGHAGAPAPSPTAAAPDRDAHAPSGSPAPARKPPTVSRVTLPPAKAAPDDHGPPAGREAGHGSAESGYVATGAPAKNAAAAAKKKKPVVSGSPLSGGPPAAHGADAGAHPPAPAAAHGTPPAGVPTVSPSPVATSTAPAGAPPAVAAATKPAGPTRLVDVHGRLAAALAGVRQETGSHGAAPRPPGSDDDAAQPAEKTPRITLSWPKPRWHVVWPAAPPAAVPEWATADPTPGRPPRR